MTDSTRQPGDLPERSDEARPAETGPTTAAAGASTAPAGESAPAPAPAPDREASVEAPKPATEIPAQHTPTAETPAQAPATQPPAVQAPAPQAPAPQAAPIDSPAQASAAPAAARPETPATAAPAGAPAGAAHPDAPAHAPAANAGTAPTTAYPRDAFGQPASPQAPTYNPYATNPYATGASSYGGGQAAAQHGGTPKAPARRKGSAALVAALAIGALVGGASGAGVTALVLANQTNGVPASQAEGPSNVVVNDTDNVNQITAVAAKASPSVVTIDVAGSTPGQAGTGSGVILSEDGFVLTNTHVVTLDGAAADVNIQVRGNDGRLFSASIVGTDPVSDLAVIKLDDAEDLQPITWGDSDKLNVGDTTIAIGAPLGLAGTVTNGIVSALNRSITVASSAPPSAPEEAPEENEGSSPFDFYFDIPGQEQDQPQAQSSISLSVVQTDAAINPGNSGGALLDGTGKLIGINVAIANAGSSSGAAGSIGVGFAVPSSLAKRVADEIIENGKATHGLLGATVGNAASEAESTTVGALIDDVTSGGAAEEAGLRSGDIVTNFNGVPITDANDLTAQVRALPAGGTAELTYVRNGEAITVSVTVGELAS